MPLNSGTSLGPYEIVALLGAGGMGEVYRARDRRLGRDVAVKVLPTSVSQNSEVRARFEREARIASALNHPHICVLHDEGWMRGRGGFQRGAATRPPDRPPAGVGDLTVDNNATL